MPTYEVKHIFTYRVPAETREDAIGTIIGMARGNNIPPGVFDLEDAQIDEEYVAEEVDSPIALFDEIERIILQSKSTTSFDEMYEQNA